MEREIINTARQAAAFLRDQLDVAVREGELDWYMVTDDGELSFDSDEKLIAFARAEQDMLTCEAALAGDLLRGAALPSLRRGADGMWLIHAENLKGGAS